MDYIDIFIKNNYINLKQIAESGQCFRWKKDRNQNFMQRKG